MSENTQLTEKDVQLKIKEMIAEIMNASGQSAYNANMIKDGHDFEKDLHFTKYEKYRIIFRSEEFFKIDLSSDAEGTRTVKDLTAMVVKALGISDAQEETTETETAGE